MQEHGKKKQQNLTASTARKQLISIESPAQAALDSGGHQTPVRVVVEERRAELSNAC